MKKSNDKYPRLFLELAKARSLWDICDTAYALLGNPVFVTDTLHTVLAYTKCVDIGEPMWHDGIVQGNLEGRTLKESGEVRQNHKESTEKDAPIMLPPSGPFKHSRLLRTIMDKDVPIGCIVDSGTFRDCDWDDADLVEIIAAFTKPFILTRYSNHLENVKSKGNFFIGLLDGTVGTKEILAKRMKSLCIRQHRHWYALAFTSGHPPAADHKIKNIVREISLATKHDSFVYDDQIVSIIGADKTVRDWGESYPVLHELIAKYGLMVGVSRHFASLLDVRKYYAQANRALDAGMALGHHSPYMLFDDLAFYGLFADAGETLSDCCSQKIRDLYAYDEAHNMNLCITLQAYLESGRNLSRTAELIFVHKNTVRYRIEKCMEFLYGGNDREGDYFSTLLSLRILEYESKVLSGTR